MLLNYPGNGNVSAPLPLKSEMGELISPRTVAKKRTGIRWLEYIEIYLYPSSHQSGGQQEQSPYDQRSRQQSDILGKAQTLSTPRLYAGCLYKKATYCFKHL